MQHLPEGTTTFNMLQAPSGHVMLPCCKYPTPHEQAQPQDDGTLTLHATASSTPPIEEVTPTPQPAPKPLPANPWNAFQQRYGRQGLTKEEFTVFYRWQPRQELEQVYNETEVVQQFLALEEEYVLIPLSDLEQ